MPSQRELNRRDTFNDRLIEHIKARRIELGITHTQMAKALHISRVTVTLMEMHRRKAQLHELQRFCKVLKWSMSELLPPKLFAGVNYARRN